VGLTLSSDRQFRGDFAEKGGKSREITVRHDLEILINEYITSPA
jgi:hypothetical protein